MVACWTASYKANTVIWRGGVTDPRILVEYFASVAYPGILFRGGQQIQLRTEDRENGDLGGGSPLVRGSGGSCNMVQEISFHMVQFS